MGHKHSVYDSDTHFSINPITRVIKNESSRKTTLIQGDHNSERFTFEIQRLVEGHDMAACDRVEIHYINVDATGSNQSADVYEVDDLQVSPDDSNVVICSWLISKNATMYAGSLNFTVRFVCLSDGVVSYAWHSAIHSDIYVSSGILNDTEAIITPYVDVLAQWKADLFGVGDTQEQRLIDVSAAQQNAIQAKGAESLASIPEDYTVIAAKVNEFANAIKGNASGEIIRVNDVSTVEHRPVVKVRGKNLFDVSKIPTATASASYAYVSEVGTDYIVIRTEEAYDGNGYCTVAKTLKEACPSLEVGKTYILTASTESNSTNIYLPGIQKSWIFGRTMVMTEAILNSTMTFYGLSAREGYGTGDCRISNIQIEEGETATEYTPYIAPETVNVVRCGKNLFPVIVKDTTYANGSYVKLNDDGSYLIHNNGDNISFQMSAVLPTGTYRLSNGNLSVTDNLPYVFVNYGKGTAYQYWIFTLDEPTECLFSLYSWKDFKGDWMFYPQLEFGENQTDYEPYDGITAIPAPDGTVSGLTSASPNMTILTDKAGVNIECEYNVDTKTYIDNLVKGLMNND